jgi:hypothetical protein
MKLHIEVDLRRIVHPQELFETMAHDFEHQVALLYGEGLDDEHEDAEETETTSQSPAARDASKYAH